MGRQRLQKDLSDVWPGEHGGEGAQEHISNVGIDHAHISKTLHQEGDDIMQSVRSQIGHTPGLVHLQHTAGVKAVEAGLNIELRPTHTPLSPSGNADVVCHAPDAAVPG